MKRRAGFAFLLAVAGCGRDASPPVAPGPPPAMVVEVAPPPRSTGVPFDTEIWARFDQPMDTTAVDDTTITLRVDARYVPVHLTWDAGATRVTLHPLEPLALYRTHTVHLASRLRSATGVALGEPHDWQFRVSAVRTPDTPSPPDGADPESPFVRLSWRVEAAPSGIEYVVLWDTDSSAVAAGTTPNRTTTTENTLLPRAPWPLGATVHWSVEARHVASGETSRSPVWRFRTFPENAPTETVTLPLSDWSYLDRELGLMRCYPNLIYAGGEVYIPAIRWDLRPFAGRKLAAARVRLGWSSVSGRYARPELWTCDYWDACDIQYPGPPGRKSTLGLAAGFDGANVDFQGTTVTIFVEALMRYRGYHGFALYSQSQQVYQADRCLLTLTFYSEQVEADVQPAPSRRAMPTF